MFDAYTIKKVLPRLVIAVILIQLSWFIFTGMIELMANISYGIEGLILAPFGGADKVSLVGIFNASGLGVGAGIAGLALAGTVGVVAAGGPIALAIIVILALVVGFFVLVIRRVLLVALLILSPLALVAWILPGTERFWKMWWENFSKLLLMFPLILLLLTVGRVFAYVYATTISQPGILEMSVIIVSVFAPIAMIPLTYKAAGVGLGFIAGAIKGTPDKWGNAARERGRKKGAERRAAWKERAGREALFQPNSGLGRAFNKPAMWLSSPYSGIAHSARNKNIPFLSGRGRQIASSIHHKQMEQTGKAFQELNNMFGSNDRAYRALNGAWYGLDQGTQKKLYDAGLGEYDDEGRLMAKQGFGSWKDLEEMQHILSSSDNENERTAGAAIHGAMPRLNTMFSDPEMGYASVQGASLIGLASHGFANDEDLEKVGNQMLTQNGGDVGAVQGVLAQAELGAARAGRADIKPGYGHVYDQKTGKIVRGSKAHRDNSWVETMTASDLASAKGGLIKDRRDVFEQIIKDGSGAKQLQALEQVNKMRRSGMSEAQVATQHGPMYQEAQKARRAQMLASKIQMAAGQYGGGVEVSRIANEILAGVKPELLQTGGAQTNGQDPSPETLIRQAGGGPEEPGFGGEPPEPGLFG